MTLKQAIKDVPDDARECLRDAIDLANAHVHPSKGAIARWSDALVEGLKVGEGQRKSVELAIANYCAHDGEPEPDKPYGDCCPECRKMVDAVMAVLAAAQHLKREQEPVRCNRCQANLCEHDNCTDWTCARACSKCAKGPREQEPASQELEVQLDRLDEQWKGRCRVLMGDKEKLKAEVKRLVASQPPQELVSLVAEWREDAAEIRKGCEDKPAPNVACQACEWHATGLEQCATQLETALTRGAVGPAEAALRAETPAPLLHKTSTHKPSGCYCPPNDCQAPKIMGRQVPCSRPCETYTEMCKPGSSVKLRYYCVLPKNHTKPHAFHATAEQARAETPTREPWEEQFDKKFVSEADGPLKMPDGYDTGLPCVMWKVHPNGQCQLALPQHFKEFIRAIRNDGTIGGIRAAGEPEQAK